MIGQRYNRVFYSKIGTLNRNALFIHMLPKKMCSNFRIHPNIFCAHILSCEKHGDEIMWRRLSDAAVNLDNGVPFPVISVPGCLMSVFKHFCCSPYVCPPLILHIFSYVQFPAYDWIFQHSKTINPKTLRTQH